MTRLEQIRNHTVCLRQQNWKRPSRWMFHLKGIGRAVLERQKQSKKNTPYRPKSKTPPLLN